MVVVNKDFIRGLLLRLKLREDFIGSLFLTLKLSETMGPGNPYCPTSGTRSIEFPDPEQKPPESLQIPINEDDEEEERSLDSEWVISIKEKLDQARQDDAASSLDKISIYKIPHYLRDIGGDDKAFVPQIVSLGPYHHDKERLHQMEPHKWRLLQHVLERTNHDIKLYLDSMKEIEERVRCCYEGPISLKSNEFVEMLVLDGCFVLELFRGATKFFKNRYSRNDPIFALRGSIHLIQRDMIMLENQLPLFVLDRLLGIQLGDPNLKGRVANLALIFFDPLKPTGKPLTENQIIKLESSLQGHTPFNPLGLQDDLHCLDVFRRSLLRTGSPRSPKVGLHCVDVFRRSLLRTGCQRSAKVGLHRLDVFRRSLLRTARRLTKVLIKQRSHSHGVADKRRQKLIHGVTQLKEAGIKFRKRETDRFWDIKFKNGILKIPKLLIDDGTKSLFSNLIAFERSHLDCSNEITSYVVFMDHLINSPADVEYLHYCGIIEHWLGSAAEVADLFNRLCQEVVFDSHDSYLSQVSEDLNRYYGHRWNTWRASLEHNYFSNPWAIISFVAAVVLLLLTFAQTYYTIYGYYRPGS